MKMQSESNSTLFQQETNRPAARAAARFTDNRPATVYQRKLQQTIESTSGNNTSPIQRKPNQTGLPDQLKSGIENLSGYAMDDVKVHYNSSKPAQLNALAYAQGTNIHLGPGQEKHLPHEAWHVVQQKQGRVKPTVQLRSNMKINDDAGLEREADEMGAKALTEKRENENVRPVGLPSDTYQFCFFSKMIKKLSRKKRQKQIKEIEEIEEYTFPEPEYHENADINLIRTDQTREERRKIAQEVEDRAANIRAEIESNIQSIKEDKRFEGLDISKESLYELERYYIEVQYTKILRAFHLVWDNETLSDMSETELAAFSIELKEKKEDLVEMMNQYKMMNALLVLYKATENKIGGGEARQETLYRYNWYSASEDSNPWLSSTIKEHHIVSSITPMSTSKHRGFFMNDTRGFISQDKYTTRNEQNMRNEVRMLIRTNKAVPIGGNPDEATRHSNRHDESVKKQHGIDMSDENEVPIPGQAEMLIPPGVPLEVKKKVKRSKEDVYDIRDRKRFLYEKEDVDVVLEELPEKPKDKKVKDIHSGQDITLK